MTADFRAVHHRPLDMVPDPQEWIDAHIRVADKWDGKMGVGAGVGSWKQRARRAEADASAARLIGHMRGIAREARCESWSTPWTRPPQYLLAGHDAAAPLGR